MTQERDDILEALTKQRDFLRQTVAGITDEQAAQPTTVSELCLGGLIKHVSRVEQRWTNFIRLGTEAMAMTPDSYAEHANSFKMVEGETLAGLLADYEAVAAVTDALVREVPSLDDAHALPDAPWFPPGKSWTARRVFMHIVAETAQHAGHADILREAIDGQKTMG